MSLRIIRGLRCALTVCLIGLLGCFSSPAAAASKAEKLVIIVVDGLRPDALKQAKTPTIDSLIKRGSFTMKAQTVSPSLTLPAVASLLSGLPVEQHGVTWNEYEPQLGYLKAPTVFELASFLDGKWAAVYLNKEKLVHIAKPDRRLFLHVCSVSDPACTAQKIAGEVISTYKTETEGKPSLFLVHFADPDVTGHAKGWMSKPYLQAVEAVDRAIGALIQGFKELGLFERTVFIVTADHGGHEKTHGTTMPEDMTVPWIAAGPGIKANHEISQPVSIMDTPATVLQALGITEYFVEWNSRSVEEIFEKRPVPAAPGSEGKTPTR